MGLARWAAVVLIAAALAGPAAAELKLTAESEVPAETHQYTVHSAILDRDLIVRVAAPARPPAEGGKVAVFYTLDATTSFDLVASIARSLQRAGKMAPAYVVAVGYPGDRQTVSMLRTYDYLHVQAGPYPNGGGGAKFEQALNQEIRPFVEARLPIDPAKAVLGGHSFGGLFTAHVATEHPDSYTGYLVSSGSLWVGDEQAVKAAAELAKSHKAHGRRIYISVGGEEPDSMTATSARYYAALSAANSGFQAERQLWPGETHGSVFAWALLKGLPFLLPPDPARTARAED
jgi:predicted alpha/beta superfamily hydrolase